MNGKFQMQEGKNWILPQEMNANRFWLEILVKPLLSLYGTEWRERGYGLRPGVYVVPGQMSRYVGQC
jgi:hypothetical protein